MRVAVIFDKLVEGTTGIYAVRALKELGHEADHYWLRDADKIAGKYDLYFRVDHGFYDHDLPKHLKPSVYWALDIHHPHSFKAVTQIHRNYNFLFGCHRTEVEELKLLGVDIEWLPVGCDPLVHVRKQKGILYDIAFVGGDDGIPRKYILQELHERYPDSFIGQAPFHEMSDLYNSAKIGFNYSIRSDLNMRFFEVMACGTMLLTNSLPREDLRLLDLIPGSDFVEYKTFDELFALMEYYLKNGRERLPIAEKGHRKILQSHTYAKRMEFLMEKIKSGNSRKALQNPE